MLERIGRLEELLSDAVLIAETANDATLLRKLRDAQTSLRGTTVFSAPVNVDVLAGRVFFRGLPLACPPAELAVIVALAQSEIGLSRDALAELLYPDRDATRKANTLKVYVHRARRRIPSADFICTDRGRIRLGAAVDVDVRRLIRELSFFRTRGGYLNEDERQRMEGFRLRLADGRPPEMLEWEWFEDVELSLIQHTREVTALLAEDALQNRQYQRAITLAQDLARADPIDEVAAEVAIRAFLLAGNQMAAVLEYRHYESRLVREVAASPSPRLRALVDDVLSGISRPLGA